MAGIDPKVGREGLNLVQVIYETLGRIIKWVKEREEKIASLYPL